MLRSFSVGIASIAERRGQYLPFDNQHDTVLPLPAFGTGYRWFARSAFILPPGKQPKGLRLIMDQTEAFAYRFGKHRLCRRGALYKALASSIEQSELREAIQETRMHSIKTIDARLRAAGHLMQAKDDPVHFYMTCAPAFPASQRRYLASWPRPKTGSC